MSRINRREFVGLLGGGLLLGAAGIPLSARAGAKARVVVIGGGYGGATAAKYLRLYDPGIEVMLIDRDEKFISCPLSNEVLSGERAMESLTIGFDGLAARGVKVVHAEVGEIDAAAKRVKLGNGQTLGYDYLVVSPGVDLRWDSIAGYSETAAEIMPHAWKAGPQTLLLKKQIESMPDGGTVIIAAPPNPFRCPPGPYERAAQIALYCKHHKPRSKIMILDAKSKFSKQGLFQAGWKQHYGDMITWVSSSDDGKVLGVDTGKRIVMTEFAEHHADVANIIPAQKAGAIAARAGLVDESGWCPVDQRSFESTLHKDVFVIGDACIAGAMPKSGYAANSQGKVAAANIAARANGHSVAPPSYVNTCYSLIAPEHGISVAGVYQFVDGKIVSVKNSGGVSPADGDTALHKREAVYAHSWYRNIVGDIWG
ncbi:MAG: FAD-dependent oxidoreductase [Chromatiales bacterium]|nr:FAD-dependent oxidoreductase [Chromatiales bacterium]